MAKATFSVYTMSSGVLRIRPDIRSTNSLNLVINYTSEWVDFLISLH